MRLNKSKFSSKDGQRKDSQSILINEDKFVKDLLVFLHEKFEMSEEKVANCQNNLEGAVKRLIKLASTSRKG